MRTRSNIKRAHAQKPQSAPVKNPLDSSAQEASSSVSSEAFSAFQDMPNKSSKEDQIAFLHEEATSAIDNLRKRSCTRREALFLLVICALLSVATWAISRLVIGLAVVRGSSMESSLRDGDFLLLWRLASPEKNEVAVFHLDSGEEVIKRIIAIPGDVIDVRKNGSVYINGKVENSEFATGKTMPKEGVTYPLELGSEQYFVLGDNREDSRDSRNFGPVSRANFTGSIITTLRF